MKSGCVHVAEVDTTCVGSASGLLLSRRYVDLVCEDVIDERSGHGEVESDEQLVQGLSVARTSMARQLDPSVAVATQPTGSMTPTVMSP
jgi:hypothetical protein